MSTVNQRLNTPSQATTDYDLSKIFILNNRYENDNWVNNSNYDPLTLKIGTLMGRVAATNVLVPLDASKLDGSQFPVGILAQDITLSAGATDQVAICVSGDVAQEKVIFWTGNNMSTVVAGRTLHDRIGSDTVGIKLVPGTEMTDFDN